MLLMMTGPAEVGTSIGDTLVGDDSSGGSDGSIGGSIGGSDGRNGASLSLTVDSRPKQIFLKSINCRIENKEEEQMKEVEERKNIEIKEMELETIKMKKPIEDSSLTAKVKRGVGSHVLGPQMQPQSKLLPTESKKHN